MARPLFRPLHGTKTFSHCPLSKITVTRQVLRIVPGFFFLLSPDRDCGWLCGAKRNMNAEGILCVELHSQNATPSDQWVLQPPPSSYMFLNISAHLRTSPATAGEAFWLAGVYKNDKFVFSRVSMPRQPSSFLLWASVTAYSLSR